MPTRQDTRNPHATTSPNASAAPATDRRSVHSAGGVFRRVLVTLAGGTLCAVGIALLVLPGPGLLLVLGGLALLATEYPWARRLTSPVRSQAIRAARQSVSTTGRIAVSGLCAAMLITAGVLWMLLPWLPFSGITTGTSLLLSGTLMFALLIHSHRRFNPVAPHSGSPRPQHRAAPE